MLIIIVVAQFTAKCDIFETMNSETNKGSPAPSETDPEEHSSNDDEIIEDVVNHSQAVSM